MGRLQKRKKPVGKKNKKSASDLPVSSPKGPTSAKSASLAAFSSKDSKKHAVPSKKKAVTRATSGTRKTRKNYLDVSIQFLREVMMELRKVTWPSRKQTTGSTIVMIILVAMFSIFLGTVDIGLNRLVQVILQ